MLKRIVSLLIAFPLGAVLVAIAVSNRQPVALILDPFRPENPALSIELPFYAYLLGALLVGVIIRGIGGVDGPAPLAANCASATSASGALAGRGGPLSART